MSVAVGEKSLSELSIRALTDADRGWLRDIIRQQWGSEIVVSRGHTYDPASLPGFVAEQDAQVAGVATYHVEGEACELVTIDSLIEGRGIGTALIEAVAGAARTASCLRLWLVTTNDNVDALRLYQKRGFRLSALYPDAIAQSRTLKPEIPLSGAYGIPIRDEIVLEMRLDVDEK
ncbi:MAG: GNAT family N-acetyltransferase [Anaerolineae bacterium]|nr:GNAT family N-acetyltransferase [Anaerolineae bacterium]